MPRPFRIAGIVAGLVLIPFGAGAVVIGLHGHADVNESVERERIVGSADMKPSLTAVAIREAGLDVALPACDVAGKAIKNGTDAKCFASYMNIHALVATGGETYSQMAQYASADGRGTSEAALAVTGPVSGRVVS